MQRHQNTFVGGLDKDSSINKYANSKFFDSENFRIIINEENATGALVNIKGTELKVRFYASFEPAPTIKIIGIDRSVDSVIFFVQISTTVTEVYVIPIEDIETGGLAIPIGAIISEYRVYYGEFGFTYESKIRTLCRKENENIHKVYFTDGKEPLRFMNFAESNRTILVNTPVSKLEIVPDVKLSRPEILGLISGRLKSGRVQYAYQLYNINGAESAFSPASDLVNLTSSSESINYRNFKGSDIGVDSGKGVSFSISNVDTRFDRVRVVRILHEDLNLQPQISIVYEGQYTSGVDLEVSDFGTANLGEFTVEEFTELLLNPIPQTLESKNNYLLIANTEEETFDFNYTAQAFRKKDDGNTGISYTGISNPFNNYFKTASEHYKYHTVRPTINGVILGGKGTNVEYQFRTKKIKLDATANATLFGDVSGNVYSYAQQEHSTKYVGYQRDEIYRFGLVGYDSKMRPSFVKWIDDIRFPDFEDGTETYNSDGAPLVPGTPARQVVRLQFSNPTLDPTNYKVIYTITFTIGTQSITTQLTKFKDNHSEQDWEDVYQVFYSSFVGNEPFGSIFLDPTATDYTTNPDELKLEFYCNTGDFSTSGNADIVLVSSIDPSPMTILYGVTVDPLEYTSYVAPVSSGVTIENDYNLTSEDAGELYAHVLYPAFKIKNLPRGVEAVQIVRAKRDGSNRTVVDMGTVSTLLDHTVGSYTKRFSGVTAIGANRTTLDYHSPEHLFNRAYGVTGDYLESIAELSPTTTEFTLNDQIKITKSKTYTFISGYKKSKINSGVNHIHNQNIESITTFGSDFVKNEAKFDTGLPDPALIAGTKGSCKLIKTDTDVFGGTSTNGLLGRRRYTSYPYGGITESSLANTEYIAVSDIYRYDSTELQSEQFIDVFNGDTYIGYFEYLRTIWDYDGRDSEKRLIVNEILPVESTINLQIINNDTFNSLYDGSTVNLNAIEFRGMQEIAGSWRIADTDYYNQTFNLYTYNSVYSKQNDVKKFYPAPLDVQLVADRPYRIYYSDRKIPGEFADRWTKFRPNNFLDVDTKYGEIIRLFNFRDTVFYFQPEGFGALLIEPKEMVQTSTPGPLVVGTGEVLGRYQYFSTKSGLSDYDGIVGSRQAVYYYDKLNRKVCRVEQNGARFLSDEKYISSYIKNLTPDDNVILGFDNNYSEVLFYIGDTNTLVFSELLDVFYGFHSYVPEFFISIPQGLYTVSKDDSNRFYKHGVGDYGLFYEDTVPDKSTITLIINPQGNNVSIYDVVELTLEVLAENNDNTENLCVDSIRLYNEYQDTGTIALVPDDNIIQRFRTWRINTLIDNTEVDEPRLRSASIFMDITYDNVSNYKVILHDIVTKFRSTIIR